MRINCKRWIMILGLLPFFALQAQPYVMAGLSGGYQKSAFRLAGYTETFSLPVGLQLSYGRIFKFGVEASTNYFSPYSYGVYQSQSSDEMLYRVRIIQHDVLLVLTIELGHEGVVNPYIRGGVGGSMGSYEVEGVSSAPPDAESAAFDGSLGWNAGGGINLNLGGSGDSFRIFAEYIYQSFPKETADNTLSFDGVSMQYRFGIRFPL